MPVIVLDEHVVEAFVALVELVGEMLRGSLKIAVLFLDIGHECFDGTLVLLDDVFEYEPEARHHERNESDRCGGEFRHILLRSLTDVGNHI